VELEILSSKKGLGPRKSPLYCNGADKANRFWNYVQDDSLIQNIQALLKALLYYISHRRGFRAPSAR
jgi:hypothetical protein